MSGSKSSWSMAECVAGGHFATILPSRRSRRFPNRNKAGDIPTRELPAEFRFITSGTTIQEVIDKVGPYSRIRKHLAHPSFGTGYGLSTGPSGMPMLVLVEYDLPYHAAVILLPEPPFQPQDRIRAAFYRPPRPDEEG
jgi:hypothetical protein